MPDFLSPFSAYSGPRHPRALFVGEAWGESEDSLKLPLVGESGKELWRMLGEATPDLWPEEHSRLTDLHRYGLAWSRGREQWMSEASIAFTNVLNLRPPNNKIPELCCRKADLPKSYPYPELRTGLYLRPEFLPHVERLYEEIRLAQPNLVVALGNTACWALLLRTNIAAIRGTITETHQLAGSFKLLPTYHPASVLYENVWKWRPIIVVDLMKAFREAQFPEIRRPKRQVLVNGTLDEYTIWAQHIIFSNLPMLSCDIETGSGLIKCIGFGACEADSAVIPFRDANLVPYWPDTQSELAAWQIVFDLLECPIPKLFQNGLYDLQYLLRLGCKPKNVLEDSMLLHHALYPELQKGLGFLGSIYTDEPAWKLMRRKRPDTEKRDE